MFEGMNQRLRRCGSAFRRPTAIQCCLAARRLMGIKSGPNALPKAVSQPTRTCRSSATPSMKACTPQLRSAGGTA